MINIFSKIIILVLIFSISLTGCKPNGVEVKENLILEKTNLENKTDEELIDYVINDSISSIESKFTNEDYEIHDIVATYVSKEYLEESNYNSLENIYFGYKLSDLSKKFKDDKYIFTVDENNKTIVTKFEDFDDTYNQMIKNVAIGSGVILVGVTLTCVSSGTMVSTILAASAKTASEFALTGSALSGITTGLTDYAENSDIKSALKSGALSATEGFKYGAITGAVTGGIYKGFEETFAAIKGHNIHKKGAYAEARVMKKYHGDGQVSFLNGKIVKKGTANASRPDIVRTLKDGTKEAIEIKNYNLAHADKKHIDDLCRTLKHQVSRRNENLPKDFKQRIILYLEGQNLSKDKVELIKNIIQQDLNDVYHNIPIDIFA